jgi:hypothetical protein
MSALSVYREKVKLKGYSKSVEVEQKVAAGELPVLPRSLLWEKEWAPFREMLERAASILPQDVAGRGIVIAKLLEAKKYLVSPMFKNVKLAVAAARQAVEALVDLGVDRERAIGMVSDITGISKSLLRGGRAGAGAAPGA